MSKAVTVEYKTFLKEIKNRIYKAQYDALKAVNKELIHISDVHNADIETHLASEA